MLELCGKSVSKGIAIGKIYFHSNINNVPKYEVENPEKELERYKKALVLAKENLMSLYKSSLEAMGYSSDEVNLRKMAKEKASELTKTITDKAKGSTEQAADSAKAAVKNAADSLSNKVSETAEKAKDAAIAAKDAAVKTFENGKSSSSTNSSSTAKK